MCCLNAQSLHHKNDWTSRNFDYTFGLFTLLYSYTGCIFFSLLPKPISYEMSFYQNPINNCNMAIYCNTLKYNMQYGINLYCFTPNRCLYTSQTQTYHYICTYIAWLLAYRCMLRLAKSSYHI